jgi:hypothetical protein
MFGGQYLPGIAAADQPFPVFLFDRAGVLMRGMSGHFGSLPLADARGSVTAAKSARAPGRSPDQRLERSVTFSEDKAWPVYCDLPTAQKRWPHIALCVFLLGVPVAGRAVIVDRVAIAVGDKIITDSEIDQRIRLTAFQNKEKADLSPASRRKAAQQLVDQKLIEREMDVGRYPRLEAVGRKTLLTDYEKTGYKSDLVAMTEALAAYGLTPRDLEDDLGRQSDLLTFLNLRFRPAVQVTDQDIQKYYDENVLKDAAGKTAEKAQAGALNEMRAAIEQKLTGERADHELDLWLQDQRKRTRIEYLEKDLQGDQK